MITSEQRGGIKDLPSIDTLVDDIYDVIQGKGGWDEAVAVYHKDLFSATLMDRLGPKDSVYSRGGLRLSNIGESCERKLWYDVNDPDGQEELRPNTLFKFLYGDMLEDLVIALAVAAGHKVEGLQTRLEIDGIVGHRDVVIDGMVIDVKSASPVGFKKFEANGLREDDGFGYLPQLTNYLYASQDDPVVTVKDKAGFLAVDKVNGHICLDVYNLTQDMVSLEDRISYRKKMVEGEMPMERIPPVDHQKGGNKQLAVKCRYCGHKEKCWPLLRTFIYSTGPVFLTKTVKVPNVPEVTKT